MTYQNGELAPDMTEQQYRAHEGLGSTQLKNVLGFGSPGAKAANFGTAVHLAALEPQRFADEVRILPKFSGRGAKAAREEYMDANADKLLLTASEYEMAMELLEAFQVHPIGRVLEHQAAVFETPILCEDAETGIKLKSKPDIRCKHIVYNLKTAADASVAEFERKGGGRLWRMGYAQQAAHELDAAAALGIESPVYCIVAVQKTRPVRLAVYEISDHPDDLERGWIKYGRRMNRAALTIEAARRARGDVAPPVWWDQEPLALHSPMPFVAAEVEQFERLAKNYSKGVI